VARDSRRTVACPRAAQGTPDDGGSTLDTERELAPVEVEDGRVVLVEVRRGTMEEDVSSLGRFGWDDIGDSIDAITRRMQTAIANARPRRASVEFGLDVGVESGKLTSMLVKGSGSATLTIKLEWESDPADA
jgi:NTP-dependent ternary system trypsin peptidase co-occuring protein